MALNPAQHSELAARLDMLDRELQLQIRETVPQLAQQSFADLAGAVYDAGDESVATMIEELSHSQLERCLRELRKIQRARKRLADGEINECVECGDDIGYRRLHVHPVATRCIRCQARHERMFGAHVTAQA